MRKLFLLSVIVLHQVSNVSAQKLTAFKTNNGLWGFMDSKTKAEIIKPQYNDAHGFSYGYAAVKKNGKWFYINKSGQKICDKTFDKAGNFDEYGVAIVSINGEWGKLYYGSLMYDNCELMKASGLMGTIDKETYLQEEKLGWIREENDGFAEMDDATAKMWDAYANNKLAKSADDLYKKSSKKYFHKNGKISAVGDEINGKKVGQWSFYNEKGCLVSSENYNNDGIADGNFNRYFCFEKEYGYTVYNPTYKTGSLKNGKQDGLVIFYNPNNGSPAYTELWENGVFKKVKDIYDSNGNLLSSNGTGTVNAYREDSKYLSSKMEYQNGHRAGVGVWYHPNKTTLQVRQRALYKYDANDVNGLRWEIIEINDYNGKPLPKGTLKNGNGTWISYDDYDKPTIITTYQNGKKVKEETALVKDIDKIYENINTQKSDKKIIAEGTSAERASGNYSYEMSKGLYEYSSGEFTAALASFKIAAEKGEQEAMVYLGVMYYDGTGTTKDYKKAYEWILKAKNKGNAKAAYQLAIMYYYGNGVTQSYTDAYKWYNVAAAKGIADADYNIGTLFESGKGVDKNPQSAFNYYKKAADKGSLPGAYATARCYHYAIGIKKDLSLATKYYEKAEGGYSANPDFYNSAAYCLFENNNFEGALKLLNHAVTIDPKYANGYDSMGEMYFKKGNKTKAVEYYQKAANMGWEGAKKWLKENTGTASNTTSANTAANLIPFENKDGFWGYKNEQGKVVIPGKFYTAATPFSEGLAAVVKTAHYDAGSESLYGYIDATGKEIISFEWKYAAPFEEGIAFVIKGGSFDDGWAMVTDGEAGFVDKKGKLLFPLIPCHRIEGRGKEFKNNGKVKVYTTENSFFYINQKGQVVK